MTSDYGMLEVGVCMKNLHLPLPDSMYAQLRAEAERSRIPATTLARQAIDAWLHQQLKTAKHAAIAAYAIEMAGTPCDLDRDLEAAAVEHLLAQDGQ